jgi:hypothetical protein
LVLGRRNTTEGERGTEHRKGQSKGVVVLLRHTSTMDEDDCWSSASGRLAQHLGMASRQSWRTGDVRGAAQRAAAALQRNGTRQAVGDGLVDVAPGEAGKAGGDGRSDVGDAGDSARGSTTWPGAASSHVPHAPLMLVLWYIAVRGVPACCRLLAHYLTRRKEREVGPTMSRWCVGTVVGEGGFRARVHRRGSGGASARGRCRARERTRERWGTARDILVTACGMYIWTRGQMDIYDVDLSRKEI